MQKRWKLKNLLSVGQVLGKVLRDNDFDIKIKEYQIWERWEELVGKNIHIHCRPNYLQNGILFVNVSSSTWMQQLSFIKSIIITKINLTLGKALVKDIHFRIGNIHASSVSTSTPTPALKKPVVSQSKPVNYAFIDNQVKDVKDEELRTRIKNLIKLSMENGDYSSK